MTLREKAALAERAARAAGEMLEHHGALRIDRKSENDFVTQMDLESEKLIRELLLSACPEDDFYGEEEGGATQAVGRWIVDPIDGTVNFMRGQRIYTISIAYEHDRVLQIGCVFCPGTDELFLGIRGEGATMNGKPIHVTDTRLCDAVVTLGLAHRLPAQRERSLAMFPGLMRAVSDIRRTGSAAYDLCSVAAGRCDAFLERGIYLYDYAAGYVIMSEAGGRFTGWAPGEDGLASGNILASNGVIHEELRRIVNSGEQG